MLTASPALGFLPLAELPWSGLEVIFTWILAAFDMAPTVVFMIWFGLGVLSASIESGWPYLLPAMGAILTITSSVILEATPIWAGPLGRKAFLAYTFIYVVILVGGGMYTAMEWNSILD